MSDNDNSRDLNKLFTQVAIASDQAVRALRACDEADAKLEEKLDKVEHRIEAKLDTYCSQVNSLTNIIARLDAESKSNTKWVGWGIAALVAIGDLVFNLMSK